MFVVLLFWGKVVGVLALTHKQCCCCCSAAEPEFEVLYDEQEWLVSKGNRHDKGADRVDGWEGYRGVLGQGIIGAPPVLVWKFGWSKKMLW